VSDEELDDVAEALVSYITISQINGDAKVHTSNMIQILAKFYKDTHSERSLRCIWERIKKRFPQMLNVDKELLVELKRQMWTTFMIISMSCSMLGRHFASTMVLL
jgi:hypothetical protein